MLIAVLAHFEIAWTVAQQGTLQPLGNNAANYAVREGFDHLVVAAPHPHGGIAIAAIIRVTVVPRVTRCFILVLVTL